MQWPNNTNKKISEETTYFDRALVFSLAWNYNLLSPVPFPSNFSILVNKKDQLQHFIWHIENNYDLPPNQFSYEWQNFFSKETSLLWDISIPGWFLHSSRTIKYEG